MSKNDESQDPQNQLNPLRNYAKALGGEIVSEYVDLASGGNSEREEALKMFNDANKRAFDLLLIWALDRFSREGIYKTLGYLERPALHPPVQCPKCYSTDTRFVEPNHEMSVYECNVCGYHFEIEEDV